MRKTFAVAVLAAGLATVRRGHGRDRRQPWLQDGAGADDRRRSLAGASYEPIISVGDTVGDYMFESIPDGISLATNGKGTVDLYVNHETSTVPFPYTPADRRRLQRLHQLAGQQAAAAPEVGRRAQRLVRDHVGR